MMGRKLSAGIACNFGKGSHGYAVRSHPEDLSIHMCEPCADAYDNLATAQEVWDVQVTSDASNLKRLVPVRRRANQQQAACTECMTALSIIDYDEASDHANEDRDEVQAAYAHVEGHHA